MNQLYGMIGGADAHAAPKVRAVTVQKQHPATLVTAHHCRLRAYSAPIQPSTTHLRFLQPPAKPWRAAGRERRSQTKAVCLVERKRSALAIKGELASVVRAPRLVGLPVKQSDCSHNKP
eukprot:2481255-Pleurochrysis_carterae.AAC.1